MSRPNGLNFSEFKQNYQRVPVKELPRQGTGVTPLATIRLLVYNHREFITRCLDSLVNQQCRYPFEILIAEDESDDGSREICLDYARRYPELIRLLLNDRRNNIAVDGNPTGLFNSLYSNFSIESKYIAMCESDDYWTDPRSLERRIDFMESHPSFSMCYHNSVWPAEGDPLANADALAYVDDDGNPLMSDGVFEFALPPPTSTILYRREWIEVQHPLLMDATCGDMVLYYKARHHGPCAFLGGIKPSIQGFSPQSAFKSQSLERQEAMGISTIDALRSYFRVKGWPTTHLSQFLLNRHYWRFKREWASGGLPDWRKRIHSGLGLLVCALRAPRCAFEYLQNRRRGVRQSFRPLNASGNLSRHAIHYYN